MASKDKILSNLISLGFTNFSDAAANKMVIQGIGDFCDNILTELQNTKDSILNTIVTQRFGKAGYYVTTAKAFQLGDDLVPTGEFLDPGYAVIDPAKQIIAQAAFEDDKQGSLSLKVAKLNTLTGLLENLIADELSSFTSYMDSFEIPGLPVTIVSLPPNIFGFTSICSYNPGYNLTTLKTNISIALTTFAQSFNFNGKLYSDNVGTYVKQQVPGVTDFFLTNTQIDGAPFLGSTSLTAGYFNYIATLLDQITYNPVSG